MDLSSVERSKLLSVAKEALKRAYAPYSKFRVGAAVLTKKGNIFSGCNIENSSYGLTVCAERVAIFSAIAQEGGENMEIRALAVFCEQNSLCSPCGACRQVIYEFGPNAIVLFQGRNGMQEARITELLPEGFCLP
ncbi:MAG: cytidine deaminase [Desulfobaccales bacterium]